MIPSDLSNFLSSMSDGRRYNSQIWLWETNLEIYPGCQTAVCSGGVGF